MYVAIWEKVRIVVKSIVANVLRFIIVKSIFLMFQWFWNVFCLLLSFVGVDGSLEYASAHIELSGIQWKQISNMLLKFALSNCEGCSEKVIELHRVIVRQLYRRDFRCFRCLMTRFRFIWKWASTGLRKSHFWHFAERKEKQLIMSLFKLFLLPICRIEFFFTTDQIIESRFSAH